MNGFLGVVQSVDLATNQNLKERCEDRAENFWVAEAMMLVMMMMMMMMMMLMMMLMMMVLLELSYGNFPLYTCQCTRLAPASKEYRFCLLKRNRKCPPQKNVSLLCL